jgi:hypothetical protein
VTSPNAAGRTSQTIRKDGQVVAVLAFAPDGITVQAAVYPRSKPDPVTAGPYRFATPAEARAFFDEAVEALTYLGCEID